MNKVLCLFLLAIACYFSCQREKGIVIPDYFPQDNRIFFDSVRLETIKFGEKLFFDKRLSKNNTVSCASCHFPELAFTDGKPISQGIYGRFSRHNSSTLLNVGFNTTFMFDMRSHNIEIQPIVPLEDTAEMATHYDEIEEKFSKNEEYQTISRKVYGSPFNRSTLTKALAAYMKSLLACDSKYDDFVKTKDSNLFSNNEKQGLSLFFGKGKCNTCHTAPLFTNHLHYNLGLEDSVKGRIGKQGATHNPLDRGRFKTPTLRNIEITHPYFHDGRTYSLDSGIMIHLSEKSKTRDYSPPSLSAIEQKQIIAFLKTLTDKKYKKTASLPLN